MSVGFKRRLKPWYISIPSNPNLYSTKIIIKIRWQTTASNVSIRTISHTATPLPKAYDCVEMYIAGRRTNLVIYGWRPKPPTQKKIRFRWSGIGREWRITLIANKHLWTTPVAGFESQRNPSLLSSPFPILTLTFWEYLIDWWLFLLPYSQSISWEWGKFSNVHQRVHDLRCVYCAVPIHARSRRGLSHRLVC